MLLKKESTLGKFVSNHEHSWARYLIHLLFLGSLCFTRILVSRMLRIVDVFQDGPASFIMQPSNPVAPVQEEVRWISHFYGTTWAVPAWRPLSCLGLTFGCQQLTNLNTFGAHKRSSGRQNARTLGASIQANFTDAQGQHSDQFSVMLGDNLKNYLSSRHQQVQIGKKITCLKRLKRYRNQIL